MWSIKDQGLQFEINELRFLLRCCIKEPALKEIIVRGRQKLVTLWTSVRWPAFIFCPAYPLFAPLPDYLFITSAGNKDISNALPCLSPSTSKIAKKECKMQMAAEEKCRKGWKMVSRKTIKVGKMPESRSRDELDFSGVCKRIWRI